MYTLSGGQNEKGNKYIYEALDWNNNFGGTLGLVVGIILAVGSVHTLCTFIKKKMLESYLIKMNNQKEFDESVVGTKV